MESSSPDRILVVAHRTAATAPLIEAVRERARRTPCRFTLLVPNVAHGLHRVSDQDHTVVEAQATLDHALPLLREAANAEVEGLVGDASPLIAIEDVVNAQGFDEVIISTLPARMSRWLKLDLPSKVAGLGLPVTTITPRETAGAGTDALKA